MPMQPGTPTGVASAYEDTARRGIEGHSLLAAAVSSRERGVASSLQHGGDDDAVALCLEDARRERGVALARDEDGQRSAPLGRDAPARSPPR